MRLGKEFNGDWENDWIGSPSDPNYVEEQQDWAQCFDNEVTAMRAVPGEHFLFDWNPAACDAGFTFADAYPGNAYVDIIGIDAYDESCWTLEGANQEGFTQLNSDGGTGSTNSIIAFAQSEAKPISFPEWGTDVTPDDPTYMQGMINLVKNDDVSYQSYFDCNCDTITPLGSSMPNSTSLYTAAFG
jgi:hypothetical protein